MTHINLKGCLLTFLPVLILTGLSSAAYAGKGELLSLYTSLKPVLEKNVYGLPIYINSRDENNIMTGTIYGVINHPYTLLEKSILPAKNWCDIAPQHLNIKACTYQAVNSQCQLTFYSGRKFYEKADDVYQLTYTFSKIKQHQNFFHIQLTATDGPAGTSQYQLDFKAIPIDSHRSFVYFNYSYHYNFITSMGMGTYLATLGSGKIGFSVTKNDNTGQFEYIDGVRGIIERNSVRYYLAIQAYLDTVKLSNNKRFDTRIHTWFDLTERFHHQLHEMDKSDYLSYKKREHQDQIRLQDMIKMDKKQISFCQ